MSHLQEILLNSIFTRWPFIYALGVNLEIDTFDKLLGYLKIKNYFTKWRRVGRSKFKVEKNW